MSERESEIRDDFFAFSDEKFREALKADKATKKVIKALKRKQVCYG